MRETLITNQNITEAQKWDGFFRYIIPYATLVGLTTSLIALSKLFSVESSAPLEEVSATYLPDRLVTKYLNESPIKVEFKNNKKVFTLYTNYAKNMSKQQWESLKLIPGDVIVYKDGINKNRNFLLKGDGSSANQVNIYSLIKLSRQVEAQSRTVVIKSDSLQIPKLEALNLEVGNKIKLEGSPVSSSLVGDKNHKINLPNIQKLMLEKARKITTEK